MSSSGLNAVATLTVDLEKRLKRLPRDVQDEFPAIPLAAIERSVDAAHWS
jgi:hypothetical protein